MTGIADTTPHRHIECLPDPAVREDVRAFVLRVGALIADSVSRVGSFLPSRSQELVRNHFTGGKLVRTQAMLLLGRCVGRADTDRLAQNGTALELVHRSTLLVDDMVDRSATRNDAGAAYVHLGCARVGFLSHLFTAKGASLCSNDLRPALLKAVEQLNLGQLAEQGCSYDVTSFDTVYRDYVRLASLKSGSLGLFALKAAVEDGNVGSIAALRLRNVAYHLAAAYQIANDLDDIVPWVQGDEATTPEDVTNGAPSLPLLLAWQSTAKVERHLRGGCLRWKGQERQLRRFFRTSCAVLTCRQQIGLEMERAMACIRSSWPDNPYSYAFQILASGPWLRSYLGRSLRYFVCDLPNGSQEVKND